MQESEIVIPIYLYESTENFRSEWGRTDQEKKRIECCFGNRNGAADTLEIETTIKTQYKKRQTPDNQKSSSSVREFKGSSMEDQKKEEKARKSQGSFSFEDPKELSLNPNAQGKSLLSTIDLNMSNTSHPVRFFGSGIDYEVENDQGTLEAYVKELKALKDEKDEEIQGLNEKIKKMKEDLLKWVNDTGNIL